jgi:hypothetical protein
MERGITVPMMLPAFPDSPCGSPGADERVKITTNDTTAGFLGAKLVGGTNVSLTTQNPGANETLRIDVTGASPDERVKITTNDTTPSFLGAKLVAGTNVSLTTQNPGGNENIRIDVTGGATDERVKISNNDTTPGFLISKLLAGFGISITLGSPGGNETLTATLNIPSGTAAPTGGNPGDVYLQYAP